MGGLSEAKLVGEVEVESPPSLRALAARQCWSVLLLLQRCGMEEVVLCIRRLQVRFRQVRPAYDQWVQVQMVIFWLRVVTGALSCRFHLPRCVSIHAPDF